MKYNNNQIDVEIVPFGNCIKKISFKKFEPIPAKEYCEKGLYPIIDQGKELISGYTNDSSKIIFENLPLIIFGDHTRVLKFVDFPFAIGADGTKIIKPTDEFDVKYFYFYLRTLKISNRGYNRHYSVLREQIIKKINISEQRTIASNLSIIQDAITAQESLIEKLQELKKNMLHHLFTYGTKGEKTKMTEIGEIPNSWEVVRLGDYFNIQQGKQVSKKNRMGNNQKGFLRTSNVFWDRIDISELDYMHFKIDEEYKLHLNYGDLLICEGGDVGRTAMWQDEIKDCYYQNHLHRVRSKNGGIEQRYLLHWLNYSFEFSKIYFGHSNVTTIPNLSQSRLSSFKIPFPAKKEQYQIIQVLDSFADKIMVNEEKNNVLNNLFESLLNNIMSGANDKI